LGEW